MTHVAHTQAQHGFGDFVYQGHRSRNFKRGEIIFFKKQGGSTTYSGHAICIGKNKRQIGGGRSGPPCAIIMHVA